MAMPQKLTPEKFCCFCGKKLERTRFASGRLEDLSAFLRRKFCNRICMSKDFDRRPVKDNPQWMTAHYHARKLLQKTHCYICGATFNLDIHHIDENWRNNSLMNLMCVCRSCHLKLHRNSNQLSADFYLLKPSV